MPQLKKSFNQIKIHSQYSICEGALKIENLKEYCKKNKIQSVGLSDTHNLSGALEFSENSSAPDKLKVSLKPTDCILFFLQYSLRFSIFNAPSQIEYCE